MSIARGLAVACTVAVTSALLSLAPASATQDTSTRTASVTDRTWPPNIRGDGCPSPEWRTDARRHDPRRMLVIGDSLIRGSRHELTRVAQTAGWLPTIRCWGGKGTNWGLQQVVRARQLKQLPRTVVISLGTNDIWWLGLDLGRGIDAMMAELGPDRQVYWVNLHFGPHGYSRLPSPTAANRVLRAKAKQYPNLTVINFARAFTQARSRGIPVGWKDGVHLNEAGYRVRVQAIMDAVGKPRSR
jgi:hypothetical protein